MPTEGLYDCVYNWDMTIMLGDVKLIFRPGSDRTKFIGDDGWIEVARDAGNNWCQRPGIASCQTDQARGTDRRQLAGQPEPFGELHSAVKTRQPPVSNITDAVRSDIISLLCDIAVRTGEKDHLGSRRNVNWSIPAPSQCHAHPQNAQSLDAVRRSSLR